jgi:cytochrome c biogenesis protein CcmG, thiol:disulfide interchange protein DsbE
MAPKRAFAAVGGLALLALFAVAVVGLTELTRESTTGLTRLTPAQMSARLAGSPPALAALHAQADELLPGGAPAVRGRLAALRGYPVVINKWASWCGPCRAELGAFQHASVELGREVAFVGVDSRDTSRTGALAFMRMFPVSYPSYYDAGGQVGEALTDSALTPVTVFYDRGGGQYIHQGPYPSAAELERDIRRYALGSA